MREGREIHVSNLDWKASEEDLKGFFSKFGKVEVARIPRKADGGSKGFGYVVFPSKVRLKLFLSRHGIWGKVLISLLGGSECFP